MREWFESVAGPAYATAMLWTLGALLLLLVVLLFIKIVRNLTFGTFVAGGRQRKARLAVMDAAAVDSHRRLVLVRRDDVEHLLLIGGPTDVVVEQNIRFAGGMRRPAEEPSREHQAAQEERMAPATPVQNTHRGREATQPVREVPPAISTPAPAQAATHAIRPQPVPTPARSAPQPVAAAAPARPPMPVAAPPRPAVAPSAPRPAAPPAHTHAPEAGDLDDALRQELEHTLHARKEPELPETVEDEMSRLLGELSRPKH